MSNHCININSLEFKELASTTGINPVILEAKIAVWQEENNKLDEYPSINDLEINSKLTIKEGISELFEFNPDLNDIGTKEQYSQYLDTIFPSSKMKDIVYHGSGDKFQGDKFDKKFQGNTSFKPRKKMLAVAADTLDLAPTSCALAASTAARAAAACALLAARVAWAPRTRARSSSSSWIEAAPSLDSVLERVRRRCAASSSDSR